MALFQGLYIIIQTDTFIKRKAVYYSHSVVGYCITPMILVHTHLSKHDAHTMRSQTPLKQSLEIHRHPYTVYTQLCCVNCKEMGCKLHKNEFSYINSQWEAAHDKSKKTAQVSIDSYTGPEPYKLESSAIEGSEKRWSRGPCRPEMSLYTH